MIYITYTKNNVTYAVKLPETYSLSIEDNKCLLTMKDEPIEVDVTTYNILWKLLNHDDTPPQPKVKASDKK